MLMPVEKAHPVAQGEPAHGGLIFFQAATIFELPVIKEPQDPVFLSSWKDIGFIIPCVAGRFREIVDVPKHLLGRVDKSSMEEFENFFPTQWGKLLLSNFRWMAN